MTGEEGGERREKGEEEREEGGGERKRQKWDEREDRRWGGKQSLQAEYMLTTYIRTTDKQRKSSHDITWRKSEC